MRRARSNTDIMMRVMERVTMGEIIIKEVTMIRDKEVVRK